MIKLINWIKLTKKSSKNLVTGYYFILCRRKRQREYEICSAFYNPNGPTENNWSTIKPLIAYGSYTQNDIYYFSFASGKHVIKAREINEKWKVSKTLKKQTNANS